MPDKPSSVPNIPSDHIYNDTHDNLRGILDRHVSAGIAECLGDRPGDCDLDHAEWLDRIMDQLEVWTYLHCRNNT